MGTGLKRTSKGSKVFAVLGGALEAGLNIPHGDKSFLGNDGRARERENEENESEKADKHIFGGHVFKIMNTLKDELDGFERQFSRYIEHGVKPHHLSEIYDKVHKAIRANPTANVKRSVREGLTPAKFNNVKLSLEQRKEK